jgi:outer membrane beta-barrel protein
MQSRALSKLRLLSLALLLTVPSMAAAQGKDVPAPPPEPPPAAPPPVAPPDAPPKTPDEGGPPAEKLKDKQLDPEKRWEEAQKTWRNIVVLPRKSFLKRRRIELMPFVGSTVGDPLIQHTVIGAELNYFLTDILAIGVRGMYYFDNVANDEFWVRYHFRRVPTLNRYRYTITGDFSYVPIYGKFTVFNKQIFQYEIYVSGGVGVTNTEVIPRNFDFEPFSSFSLTFPVGIGGRFFFTKWLAAQFSFRNYMLIDTFEKTGRTTANGEDAKANGETETKFVNNLMFTIGISVFYPLDFKYTTFR